MFKPQTHNSQEKRCFRCFCARSLPRQDSRQLVVHFRREPRAVTYYLVTSFQVTVVTLGCDTRLTSVSDEGAMAKTPSESRVFRFFAGGIDDDEFQRWMASEGKGIKQELERDGPRNHAQSSKMDCDSTPESRPDSRCVADAWTRVPVILSLDPGMQQVGGRMPPKLKLQNVETNQHTNSEMPTYPLRPSSAVDPSEIFTLPPSLSHRCTPRQADSASTKREERKRRDAPAPSTQGQDAGRQRPPTREWADFLSRTHVHTGLFPGAKSLRPSSCSTFGQPELALSYRSHELVLHDTQDCKDSLSGQEREGSDTWRLRVTHKRGSQTDRAGPTQTRREARVKQQHSGRSAERVFKTLSGEVLASKCDTLLLQQAPFAGRGILFWGSRDAAAAAPQTPAHRLDSPPDDLVPPPTTPCTPMQPQTPRESSAMTGKDMPGCP